MNDENVPNDHDVLDDEDDAVAFDDVLPLTPPTDGREKTGANLRKNTIQT